ncbi:MAG: hypothetical protein GOVbin1753_9 [Prokaryotic dsDNA virus sp.]|nr:MAG: hypothetical protein GOVbin1753_9 [Prokaryotic dsDNA virus sp.]
MTLEQGFKMKCLMCGGKLEKVYSIRKNKSRGGSRAKYKCPDCGHVEIFG